MPPKTRALRDLLLRPFRTRPTCRKVRGELGRRIEELEDRSTPAQIGLEAADVLVNPGTAAGQQGLPQLAMKADGTGFVAVWQGPDGGGGATDTGVYARIYDANWQPVGSEFAVNTTTTDIQHQAAVSVDAAGNFVVAWTGHNQPGGAGRDVYMRRFSAAGAPLSGETLVNTTIGSEQQGPSVSMNAAGQFVISWFTGGFLSENVAARAYNAAGSPTTGEVAVNSTTVDEQSFNDVAVDSAGNFVVAWSSFGQDAAGGYGVYARRFSAAGAPTTAETPVNTTTAGAQQQPRVALDSSGTATIVWHGQNSAGGSGFDILQRRFNSSLGALTGETLVNTSTADAQALAEVAAAPAGDYVITWQSNNQDGGGNGIFARRYNASGTAVGGEQAINLTTGGEQTSPAVGIAPSGDFIAAFAGASGTVSDIFLRRFGEAPVVSFASTASSPSEASGTSSYTVNRTGAAYVTANVATAVSVTRTGGTATPASDFSTAFPVTVTIAAGSTAQTATVALVNDAVFEGNETIVKGFAASSLYTIGSPAGRTITIVDDETPPTINITSASLAEGDSGTTNMTFTVSLTGQSALTTTVNFTTANGTGVAGTDFNAASGTVTFPALSTTQTVTVQILGNTVLQANRQFTVTLSSPSNASIGTGTGTGTITDDDAAATITISSGNNQTANTGSNFASPLVALVRNAANNPVQGVSVVFTAPAAGASSVFSTTTNTITVVSNASGLASTGTFAANATAGANYAVSAAATGGANPSTSFTLSNVSTVPSLSINDVTVIEGNGGTANATFTVSLTSAVPVGGVTFDIATATGTATAGDFVANSLTAQTIPAGSTTYTFTVLVNGDTLFEANEAFAVNVSNVTGATVADGTGAGTILNDDTAPSVSVDSVTANEGDAGTTAFNFTVTLSAASGLATTVTVNTANGSAVAPGDYAAITGGTLIIPAGSLTETVTVNVSGDTTSETTEAFTVTLSVPVNATLGTPTGTGTITNDDAVTTVSVAAAPTITEGGVLSYVVTLSNAVGSPVSVDFVTLGTGTATAGADFGAVSQTITFAPGVTSIAVPVGTAEDLHVEGGETVNVSISNLVTAAGVSLGTTTATGTIADNDTAGTRIFDLATAGAYTVRQNGASIEILQGATVIATTPSGAFGVVVNGTGGADTLNVDYAFGGFFGNNVTFNGAAGFDTLNVVGGSFGRMTYNYANASDGNVQNYSDAAGTTLLSTITYTSLAPLTSTAAATRLVFNLPAGPSAATLADNGTPGDNVLRLSSTPAAFEQTDFLRPTGDVTINRGNAADTLAVAALPDFNPAASLTLGAAGEPFASVAFTGAAAVAGLTAFGGTLTVAAPVSATGAAALNFEGTANIHAAITGAPATVTGGAGSDTFNVTVMGTGSDLTLQGAGGDDAYNVQLGGFATTRTLSLNDSSGTDIANLFGTTGDDSFSVNSAVPQGVLLGTAKVTYTAALERLVVNGSTGSDTFTVTPDAVTRITVDGGQPVAPATPGDTLILNVVGLVNPVVSPNPALPSGQITSSNKAQVDWSGIESFPIPLGMGGSFDFELNAAHKQDGWYSVLPSDTLVGGSYSSANVGWVTAPLGYDRDGRNGYHPPGGPLSNLLRDGAWGFQGPGEARDFRVSVAPNQPLQITALLGDVATTNDSVDVLLSSDGVNFTLLNPAPDTFQNSPDKGYTFVSYSGLYTPTTGNLTVRIRDNAGNYYWTIAGLDVRPVGLRAPIAISGPTSVAAEGATVTTYSLSAAANSLVTVAVERGVITTADAAPSVAGFQVLTDSAGATTFDVRSPLSTATITSAVTAMDVTGAAASTPFAVTYTGTTGGGGGGTAAYRFDFNGSGAVNTSGFTGVRGGDTFSTLTGYGWAAGVSEFERTAASVSGKGVVASQVPLYQDGAWGFGSGVFQVGVTKNETNLAARIYVGDSYANWPYIVLSVEGGMPVALNTSATPFGAYTLTGADANGDGRWDITISSGYVWVVNGIDIASGGTVNLPALPQTALPGRGMAGTVVTGSELAPVVAAAIDRLAAAGSLTAAQVAQLRDVRFVVGDLPSGHLGEHVGGLVRLDADAGGRGWFVDPTPRDDAEFTPTSATEGVGGRGVDLLTVVMHELSHELGATDVGAEFDPDALMTESLGAGVRRLPNGGSWALSVGVQLPVATAATVVGQVAGSTVRPVAVVKEESVWADASVVSGAVWSWSDAPALQPDWFADDLLGGVHVG